MFVLKHRLDFSSSRDDQVSVLLAHA